MASSSGEQRGLVYVDTSKEQNLESTVPGHFFRRRSCMRRGGCTCLYRRRFPNPATTHGTAQRPMVAHGNLEVADEQACPAAIPSDARWLIARVYRFLFSECRLWMELKSNPRRALHAYASAIWAWAVSISGLLLHRGRRLPNCKSLSFYQHGLCEISTTRGACRTARQADSETDRDEDST